MSNLFGWGTMPGFGVSGGVVIAILVIWTIYWKYHALWHAAKHNKKAWFIVLLIINTLGILEILYLYVFSKKKHKLNNMDSGVTNTPVHTRENRENEKPAE